MRSLLWIVASVAGFACASSARPDVAAPAPAVQEDLPPALRAPGATLLFGEFHGTRELPAFVGRVVATLAASQPVVLGLEIRPALAPSLAAYLTSDGGPAARVQLLRDPWWQDPYQDGRRSAAMLELVETARRLRTAGKRVDVELFDTTRPEPFQDTEREADMARALVALRAARPEAALVVLAGNLHTMRKGVDWKPGFEPMAMQMARAGVVFTSIGLRYRTGTAWICSGPAVTDCGAQAIKGPALAPGFDLTPSPDGNYDGWFDVGPITASPPAAAPR